MGGWPPLAAVALAISLFSEAISLAKAFTCVTELWISLLMPSCWFWKYDAAERSWPASDWAAFSMFWRTAVSPGLSATPCTAAKNFCISGAMPPFWSASRLSICLICSEYVDRCALDVSAARSWLVRNSS